MATSSYLHATIKGLSGMEALCDLAGVEYHGGKGAGGAKREKRAEGSSPGREEAEKPAGGNGSGAQDGDARRAADDSGPFSRAGEGGTAGRGSGADSRASEAQSGQSLKEGACYNYEDATGRVVFAVVRYHPKTFRQCRDRRWPAGVEHGRR